MLRSCSRRARKLTGLVGAVLGAAIVVAACAAETAPSKTAGDSADAAMTGQAMAEAYCSQCHAVGREDRSLHEDAPPFRTLSERFPIRDLEEALAEGIVVGHPDMPVFVFQPNEIDALLDYLETIQDLSEL